LHEYRQRRIEELKRKRYQERFGDVRDIARDEWISEVTEGSSTCWVVVHLYQDSVEDCNLLNEFLSQLAQKFREIKFLRIKSNLAVENWPDRNLPALFLYNGGELKYQLVTLRQLRGRSVEGLLISLLMIFYIDIIHIYRFRNMVSRERCCFNGY